MPSRYDVNHKGVAELLNSDMLLITVTAVGEQIRAHAEAIAPVGPPSDPHRGRYRASFRVRSHKRGGATHDRVECVVSNDSPEALFVEYGSAGKEPYHTLLRAATEVRI